MARLVHRQSSSIASSGGGDGGSGAGVFFNPNIGLLAEGGGSAQLRKSGGGPFDDVNVNNLAIGPLIQSAVTRPGGQSKSIRIAYTQDESETDLNVDVFAIPGGLTTSLFCRKWELFSANWDNNWPVGFKTGRYFTDGVAYHSEKMVWQRYTNSDFGVGNRNSPVWGFNNATFNEEYETAYGTPRIIAGQWHKIETWMVLNTTFGVKNGVMQVWIDDVLVCNQPRAYVKADSPTGTGWMRMWFGGNCSFSPESNGWPFSLTGATTRYRYIDSPYLSTTLDR